MYVDVDVILLRYWKSDRLFLVAKKRIEFPSEEWFFAHFILYFFPICRIWSEFYIDIL